MVRKLDITMVIFSGALLVLGFPPFDFYPLSWIALVPLLMSLGGKSVKTSFFLGILNGFVYFLGTIYWVFNSMHSYGNIPAVLSLALLIVLCLYLALYVGIFSMLFNYLSESSRFPALFLVPVFWVTLEFLRTYALTGFPWSVLGYSQYKFLTLIQIADITGVYGISFIVAAVNGAIFDIVASWPKRRRAMPLFPHWPMTVGMIILAISIIVSLSYGVWKLNSGGSGHSIKVSVVQGNIEQDKKWDVRFQKEIIDTYKRLTTKAVVMSPDLIIWPESAVPFIFSYDEPYSSELTNFQKKLDTHLIFGSTFIRGIKDEKYELSNSAILLSPDGKVVSIYDKIHLVPYGEYIPLKKFFPFIDKLAAGSGDFVKGKEYTVMGTPFARIGNLICYEIIFPGMVRKFTNKGADFLVTITNDAWFGRSSAPYQHFSMAVLRAVENRVPVARAANTGISGFIDANGRILKKSDIFVEAVLTEDIVIGAFKKSFYSQYGDLFTFLCIVSSVLLIANNIYPIRKKALRFGRIP